MFVVVLFIPVVTGNVFAESISKRVPELTERSGFTKLYTIFDPCNLKKPGKRAVSCSQLKRLGNDVTSEYLINPYREFKVRCDMETNGGGWTVIQRRGGSETFEENLFERTEKEYQDGFGAGATSYWIGNDNLHHLTNFPNNRQVLRIELTKQTGDSITVDYGHFKVGSKAHGYLLSIGNYKGPQGYDALKTYNGYEFFMGKSQFMEPYSGCYPPLSGGWWYNECLRSNLNGRKLQSTDSKNKRGLGITWFKDGDRNSYDAIYDQVEMKIRDADFDFCTGKMATYSDI
ncbi:angiopoietin-related protein 7-like [Ixodes scapularis]|uniref:angiopoietin-related protein 7-like n=1 Tax=Ixodes scapularis TaxID=6945 RepID=UPI001A9FB1ED|nr:angiopoietin-related protein 7-like [Ixodes scapularis]